MKLERRSLYDDLAEEARNTPALLLKERTGYVVTREIVREFALPFTVPNRNRILLKLEHLNAPSLTGSLYDRLYPRLFESAEDAGNIQPGFSRVVECSIGNAGAAFLNVARRAGYEDRILILPSDIYGSRIELASRLGCQLVLSPEREGIAGYVRELERLLRRSRPNRSSKNGVYRLFAVSKLRDGPSRAYTELLDEILAQLVGADEACQIDEFQVLVGSGNTATYMGRALKVRNPQCRVVAVEHTEQPFFRYHFMGLEPPLYGDWSEPDFPATAVHDVPWEKLNLDLSVLDDVVLLPRDAREEGLRLLNEELKIGAGRPSGGLFSSLLATARTRQDQSLVGVVVDGIEKYGRTWCDNRQAVLDSLLGQTDLAAYAEAT